MHVCILIGMTGNQLSYNDHYNVLGAYVVANVAEVNYNFVYHAKHFTLHSSQLS